MIQTAKIFLNGRSQAVRLPAQFRFEEEEVYVRRDEATGDVILSRNPGNWDEFFKMRSTLEIPQDFLSDRDMDPPQVRLEL